MNKYLFHLVLLLGISSSAYGLECETLDALQCMRSTSCTLDCERNKNDPSYCQIPGNYYCRVERGSCEKGISQNSLQKNPKICTEKKGCKFIAGYCFCRCDFTNDCDCECSGGAPAICVDNILR
jgi:hypothetical protein